MDFGLWGSFALKSRTALHRQHGAVCSHIPKDFLFVYKVTLFFLGQVKAECSARIHEIVGVEMAF